MNLLNVFNKTNNFMKNDQFV